MKEILEFVNKHNFLKMGDFKFSPLMEICSGISLEYCKKFNNYKCKKLPLFLCLPDRDSVSLWTAISILNNYYFEDYVNNEVDGFSFKKKQKVKIFNSIAQIERISNEKIFLKFKDQKGIPINKLRGQLSPVKDSRALSTKKRFDINYKKYKTDRNAISKILIPNEPGVVNQNNLNSKVLLIAGHGGVKELKSKLKEGVIYETPLTKIYQEDKNINIKANLQIFKKYFDQKEIKSLEKFNDFIKSLIKIIDIDDAKEDLLKISNEIEKTKGISEKLNIKIEAFFQDYEDEFPKKINFLRAKYPGIVESFPKNIRSLVVNDINQLLEYPETVAGFLDKGIPVIFIIDRNITNNSNLDLYDQIFKSNPDYFRFNFNKSKVNELLDLDIETEFIDEELWIKSKRYAEQTISIEVTKGSELDLLAPLLLDHIKEMDEFELFQKAFFNYFYPALYSIKNSKNNSESVQKLLRKFDHFYQNIKSVLPEKIAINFTRAIDIAKNSTINTKPIDITETVFSQLLPSQTNDYQFIPSESTKINLPKLDVEKIAFTGYPYSEYRGKYLLNATIVHFIPQIEIMCWPNEASLTYNYLRRRIRAGYFSDNLDKIVDIKSNCLIKNEDDFEQEINSYFAKVEYENTGDQEDSIEFIHTFKYKGYGVESDNSDFYVVKCDVLNFTDDSFMFLPHRSKILTQSEDYNGNLKISKLGMNDLKVGDVIFKYIKDRHTMRDIAKSIKILTEHFDRLEYWKVVLDSLYESCNNNIEQLKLLLEVTKAKNQLNKGNPSRSSLKNWLFDDEFLKPENDNLKLILLANGDIEIDKRLKQLDESYQNILRFTISLSSQIKKQIAIQLKSKSLSELDVNINGNKILIQARKIISIERNSFEVEYRNTRKILC